MVKGQRCSRILSCQTVQIQFLNTPCTLNRIQRLMKRNPTLQTLSTYTNENNTIKRTLLYFTRQSKQLQLSTSKRKRRFVHKRLSNVYVQTINSKFHLRKPIIAKNNLTENLEQKYHLNLKRPKTRLSSLSLYLKKGSQGLA